MKKIILRISIRLTEKDENLLWVDAGRRNRPPFSDLVKEAIQGVIDGVYTTIPLPPPPNAPLRPKSITVKFYDEDEALVEWLQKVQKGKRSLIIKELLKYCIESFDVRPYLEEQECKTEKTPTLHRTIRNNLPRQKTEMPTAVQKEEPVYAPSPRTTEPIPEPKQPDTDTVDEEWAKFLGKL